MFFSKKKKISELPQLLSHFPKKAIGDSLNDGDFAAALQQSIPKELVRKVLMLEDEYETQELYAKELQAEHPAQWHPLAHFTPHPELDVLLFTHRTGAKDQWAYGLNLHSFRKGALVERESFWANVGSLYLKRQWTSIVKSELTLGPKITLKQHHWSVPMEELHESRAELPALLDRAAKEAEEIKTEVLEVAKKGQFRRLE